MGSGEPLLNIENIINSIKYINYTINHVYFAISISGVNISNFDLILRDQEILEIGPKIQLSLHSPYDYQRKQLIPNTEDLSIILEKLKKYYNLVNRVELNYIILNNINDTYSHAKDLSEIVKTYNFHLKINRYNQTNLGFEESVGFNQFIDYLQSLNIYPEIYKTDGENINAACGQLTSILKL